MLDPRSSQQDDANGHANTNLTNSTTQSAIDA
jgi:hypothetical protein